MLFRDSGGATRMAFAAWYGAAGYRNGGFRSLWIGTLDFDRLIGVLVRYLGAGDERIERLSSLAGPH